jgi:hypothetical protein
MFAMQSRLPLVLAQRPRQRRVRSRFRTKKSETGSYRLPRDVQERLVVVLEPFRNREAAFTLAVFLARFWSAPGRLVEVFHIDRRALCEHDDLDLTERQIRSAIATLEQVGFLDRALTSGSHYKATEDGLRRKPIRFQFGSEYFPLFDAANKRAAVVRGRQAEAARAQTLVSSHRASTASAEARPPKWPKSKSEADRFVNLGHLVKENGLPPQTLEPNPQLEAALDRLLQGIRQSRGG